MNLLPLILIGVWCSPWGYKPNEFRSPRDCTTWACAYEAKTDNRSPRDYTANLAAPGTAPAPHCYDHKKLMEGLHTPCYPPRVTHPVLPTPCYPPRVTHPVLPTPCYPPHVTHPVLPTPCYPPRVTHPVLPTPCYPPRVTHPVLPTPCLNTPC